MSVRVHNSFDNAPSPTAHRRRHSPILKLGIVMIGVLAFIATMAPMIAGNLPIRCRSENRWVWPAVEVTVARIPLIGRWTPRTAPFNHPGFDARTTIDANEPVWWPPIPYGPLEITDRALAPPSKRHWLGTDDRGRDVAARLVHGTGIAVGIGLASMLLAGVIGVMVGGLAGYCGGWTDRVLSRLIEIAICFPAFILVLVLMTWLQPGAQNVILVVGLTQWPIVARAMRAETLRLRSLDFVAAAEGYGASTGRIIRRHLWPNAWPVVMVLLVFGIADAVLIEAGLSWLGFGVPSPLPSWGHLLRSGFDQIRSAPHLVAPPCVALMLLVLAFHFTAEGLRSKLTHGNTLETARNG